MTYESGKTLSDRYKQAGVDLDVAVDIKERIKHLAAKTFSNNVVSGIGGFGGVIKPHPDATQYLVASTDSVGTKVKLAAATGRYEVAGQDIVNHCVNDILPAGAQPLFFLDYIAAGRYSQELAVKTVEGLVTACQAAGCALIGGETAAMPGIYSGTDYELAGFIVGTVNAQDYLRPAETIAAGDALLAIPSSGPHTNGYTLIRRIFHLDEDSPAAFKRTVPGTDTTLEDALLQPHRSYLPDLRPVLNRIKGMAHITGGGFAENIPRMLPDGLAADLQRNSWEIPPLFRYIQDVGALLSQQMFRTFNMGVGMIVAAAPQDADAVLESIPDAWRIGTVVERAEGAPVRLSGKGG